MPLPPKITRKIGSLIRILASNQDGEALAAARGLTRTLGGAGLTLHDLAEAVEQPQASRPQRATRAQPAPPRAPQGTGMQWPLAKRLIIVRNLRQGIAAGLLDAGEVQFATDIIGQTLSPSKPRNLTPKQVERVNELLVKIAGFTL